MPLTTVSARTLALTGSLGLALTFASQAGHAAPAAPVPVTTPLGPPALQVVPRALLASPLVTIEHFDGAGAGLLGVVGAAQPGGDVPIYLLDPEGFTTFGQVAPPDGGHLIMLVE